MTLMTLKGVVSNDELTDELVASVTLIMKCYEESRSNGVRRVQSMGGSSTRRHNSEKRNSSSYFNRESPDHFSMDCKEKKESQILENYEVLYKKLLVHMKKENICLPKSLYCKAEEI